MDIEVTDFSQIYFGNVIYASTNSSQNISVYEGKINQNINVAIKIYTSTNLESYKAEVDLIKYLSGKHECFTRYYGSFIHGGSLYIIMEYCPKTLSTVIDSLKPDKVIEFDKMKKIMNNLIEAFANLESEGIYHRDIKPANILIDENFNAKIIDFSISIILSEQEDINTCYYYPVTGTMGYMAPELAAYQKANQKNGQYNLGKADVFSLGIVLIRLILLEEAERFNPVYDPDILNKQIARIDNPFYKNVFKDMLDINIRTRKSFQELLEKHFNKKVIKFPIGDFTSKNQLRLQTQLRMTDDQIYDYEGVLVNGEKVLVKFYSSKWETHREKAKCLVSCLLNLQNKKKCFLKFYGAFIVDDLIWIIHEYCSYTLQDFLIKRRKENQTYFSEKEIFVYFDTLIQGFSYCSENNIYHNQIKADSLFVGCGGDIKISNFHLPFLQNKNSFEAAFQTVQVHQQNNDDYYLSPEIINVMFTYNSIEKVDNTKINVEKNDIFSLGLVFYEIATLELSKDLMFNKNKAQLDYKLSIIPCEWIRFMLRRMLEHDPNIRADYAELLKLTALYAPYFP